MTRRHKEQDVPRNLPAARLYLDDIEQIVSIFKEAEERSRGSEGRLRVLDEGKEVQATTEFEMQNQICDDIQDLPKMGRITKEINIKVKAPSFRLTLAVYPTFTHWDCYYLDFEEAWRVFRQLSAIFDLRKTPRWRVRVHTLIFTLVGILILLFLSAASLALANKRLTPSGVILWVVVAGGSILIPPVAFRIAERLQRHTIVVLRYSWDQSAARDERNSKILLATVSAAVASVFAVLGMWLKHKFWP